VGEGERQAEHAGQLRAEPGGAEQPHRRPVRGLHPAGRGGLHRSGHGVDAPVGVPVREVVVEEAGQLGELLREVVGALVQPVGAAQGGGGRAVGPGRPPEPQVDPPGSHGLQRAELLGDHERRVVGQHHPARPEPDPLRVRGQVREDHGGRGGGHTRHGVVLGHPVPVEPARLGELRQVHAGPQGVGRGPPGPHRHQVQYGEGHGGGAVCRAPDLVACGHVGASCRTSSHSVHVRWGEQGVVPGYSPGRGCAVCVLDRSGARTSSANRGWA
jgi:hypothetical protein